MKSLEGLPSDPLQLIIAQLPDEASFLSFWEVVEHNANLRSKRAPLLGAWIRTQEDPYQKLVEYRYLGKKSLSETAEVLLQRRIDNGQIKKEDLPTGYVKYIVPGEEIYHGYWEPGTGLDPTMISLNRHGFHRFTIMKDDRELDYMVDMVDGHGKILYEETFSLPDRIIEKGRYYNGEIVTEKIYEEGRLKEEIIDEPPVAVPQLTRYFPFTQRSELEDFMGPGGEYHQREWVNGFLFTERIESPEARIIKKYLPENLKLAKQYLELLDLLQDSTYLEDNRTIQTISHYDANKKMVSKRTIISHR